MKEIMDRMAYIKRTIRQFMDLKYQVPSTLVNELVELEQKLKNINLENSK